MVEASDRDAVDVGQLIDAGRWTGFQKLIMALTALTVMIDGFDNQILGFAIPAIIKEWGVTRAAFAPIVALGLIGMAVGTALAGIVGDRFGRRPTLIGCVVLFAFSTLGLSLVGNLPLMGVLRFLAGAGIGGALPNAAAMTAEFTPARSRAVAVTSTIVCVPLGGIVGGLLAAQLLPTFGWRSLFAVGGTAPLFLVVALLFWLPESPRFLARHATRAGELAKLLARCGRPTAANARFVDLTEQKAGDKAGLGMLFNDFYRRNTVALWGAFFFTQLAVYMAFSWVPAMLAGQGLDLATASIGLTMYNFGGVVGALLGAGLISLFGSRKAMLPLALGGVVSALILILVPMHPQGSHALLVSLLGVHGFFVNAVQTTLYALAAHVYLTSVRTTGTGAALGIGRIGAILSSFAGAVTLAHGPAVYYQLLAAAMLGCLICLAFVRRHIPRSRDVLQGG